MEAIPIIRNKVLDNVLIGDVAPPKQSVHEILSLAGISTPGHSTHLTSFAIHICVSWPKKVRLRMSRRETAHVWGPYSVVSVSSDQLRTVNCWLTLCKGDIPKEIRPR